MAAFILGLLLGSLFGVFLVCLCIVAKDHDDRREE